MTFRREVISWCGGLILLATSLHAAEPVDLGGIIEKHEMIPMRDGVKLSAFLYFPPGDGPWPVLLEQRYANGNDPGTQKSFAKLAKGGYVTVLANFRGSQQSEGVWRGYRALGWGELKDGYDLVEWLGTQSWSTGKVGTFGSSQARCGGCVTARKFCAKPACEPPYVPILPVHHGCCASHSQVS